MKDEVEEEVKKDSVLLILLAGWVVDGENVGRISDDFKVASLQRYFYVGLSFRLVPTLTPPRSHSHTSYQLCVLVKHFPNQPATSHSHHHTSCGYDGSPILLDPLPALP